MSGPRPKKFNVGAKANKSGVVKASFNFYCSFEINCFGKRWGGHGHPVPLSVAWALLCTVSVVHVPIFLTLLDYFILASFNAIRILRNTC